MGLSIHYSGKIRRYDLIDELIEEVEDICKSLDWKYKIVAKTDHSNDNAHIHNPRFIDYKKEQLKGIVFTPEGSETVCLTFFPSGILCSKAKLIFNNPKTNDLMVETVSVKTQYAGMDTHIAIINLLKYLKEKYFSTFRMNDEGGYWETDDKKMLAEKFGQYNFLVDATARALKDFKAAPGDTPESLADRLAEYLKKKLKWRRDK